MQALFKGTNAITIVSIVSGKGGPKFNALIPHYYCILLNVPPIHLSQSTPRLQMRDNREGEMDKKGRILFILLADASDATGAVWSGHA
jgi:hypothetical protein